MPSCLWYCCTCDSGGPYNVLLYPVCSCEHRRCDNCSTETVGDRDSCSDLGDNVSECSEPACTHSLTSTPFYLAPTLNPTSLAVTTPHTILTHDGVQVLASLPSGTPDHSIPLTSANLVSFDASVAAHGCYLPTNSLPTEEQGRVEYRWFCCACHYGGNSYKLDQGCASCANHWRCQYCRVEKTVRR